MDAYQYIKGVLEYTAKQTILPDECSAWERWGGVEGEELEGGGCRGGGELGGSRRGVVGWEY